MAEQAKVDLVTVDVELAAAARRRQRHVDPVSRAGQSVVIDELLDERLRLAPRR